MFKLALYWQILIAIVLGVLYGCFLYDKVWLVAWMGDLFIRLLNMLVIPLIFCLLVSALANVEGGKDIGRLGFKTIAFYVVTTLIAILTGLLLVTLVKPGVGVDIAVTEKLPETLTSMKQQSFGQLLLDIVPKNVFASLAKGEMLQVVFFALLVGGFVCGMAGKEGSILRDFFDASSKLMMNITTFVIQLAPWGVFAMLAAKIGEFGGSTERLTTVMHSIGQFFLVVVGGLAFHLFITLSLILLLYRINPIKHLKNMFVPMTAAFSTATTNVTIPLSLQALEEKEGVSNRVASFTIPLGATLNMNGTALYECVVVMFIAQAYGVELTMAQMFVVTITALLTAMGCAGIPMASLVMITVILNAVGLPIEGIGLILVTDRILDMCRTTVNIYGDTCCAVCVAKTEGETINV
ncbi:MAG: dicarboxylate/amino acid:cation symporter [Planctomycetia bacterium]|nr:dicarboxylate/amino acid:cation symporter [Planctomycetia bacterium]